eukprot:362304-Chlamydomonas_euryale.AAC.7
MYEKPSSACASFRAVHVRGRSCRVGFFRASRARRAPFSLPPPPQAAAASMAMAGASTSGPPVPASCASASTRKRAAAAAASFAAAIAARSPWPCARASRHRGPQSAAWPVGAARGGVVGATGRMAKGGGAVGATGCTDAASSCRSSLSLAGGARHPTHGRPTNGQPHAGALPGSSMTGCQTGQMRQRGHLRMDGAARWARQPSGASDS